MVDMGDGCYYFGCPIVNVLGNHIDAVWCNAWRLLKSQKCATLKMVFQLFLDFVLNFQITQDPI